MLCEDGQVCELNHFDQRRKEEEEDRERDRERERERNSELYTEMKYHLVHFSGY